MKTKIISLLVFLWNISILPVYADCTVTSNINASNWTATYGTCSGIITIPSGVTLTMNADLTLPSTITELVVEDGGRIQFQGGKKLFLNENTVLTIKNTTITDAQNPACAIYAPNPGGGACNNNTAVYLGTLKYSACVGGGNVCLIFPLLVEQGGSMKVMIDAFVDGEELVDNTLCTADATNNNITLGSNITQSEQLSSSPTYNWSVFSYPIGSAAPIIANPNDSMANVTTFAEGDYIFALTITQNLSTSGCETALQQVKTVELPLTIKQSPLAQASPEVVLVANCSPTTFATVELSGDDDSKEYTITYTKNGILQTPVVTTSGVFAFEVADTEPIGEYIYEITEIDNGDCITEPVGVLTKVTIIDEPLSMNLINFDAQVNNCATDIKWTFSTTENLKEMSIQRSHDGLIYTNISSIQPYTHQLQYQFTDKNPQQGHNMYRLKIVDKMGITTYSHIVNSNSNCHPTSTNCYIADKNTIIITGISQKARITVTSINGHTIAEKTCDNSVENIDISHVNAGVYIVNIIYNDGLNQQFKVIK